MDKDKRKELIKNVKVKRVMWFGSDGVSM